MALTATAILCSTTAAWYLRKLRTLRLWPEKWLRRCSSRPSLRPWTCLTRTRRGRQLYTWPEQGVWISKYLLFKHFIPLGWVVGKYFQVILVFLLNRFCVCHREPSWPWGFSDCDRQPGSQPPLGMRSKRRCCHLSRNDALSISVQVSNCEVSLNQGFFSHFSLNSRQFLLKKFALLKVFHLNSTVYLKFPHENLINSRISCLNSRLQKINLQVFVEKRLKPCSKLNSSDLRTIEFMLHLFLQQHNGFGPRLPPLSGLFELRWRQPFQWRLCRDLQHQTVTLPCPQQQLWEAQEIRYCQPNGLSGRVAPGEKRYFYRRFG